MKVRYITLFTFIFLVSYVSVVSVAYAQFFFDPRMLFHHEELRSVVNVTGVPPNQPTNSPTNVPSSSPSTAVTPSLSVSPQISITVTPSLSPVPSDIDSTPPPPPTFNTPTSLPLTPIAPVIYPQTVITITPVAQVLTPTQTPTPTTSEPLLLNRTIPQIFNLLPGSNKNDYYPVSGFSPEETNKVLLVAFFLLLFGTYLIYPTLPTRLFVALKRLWSTPDHFEMHKTNLERI